jgi:chemotaxis protein histidine kinase CheA
MARSRNIKPGFYKNEDLAECSIWARYFFPGLWMAALKPGILEDRPKRLKAEILPFDTVDVEPLLTELHERGFIYRYTDDSGARLIFIPGFSTHQSPHYSEKPSPFKAPQLPEKWRHMSTRNLGDDPEQSENPPDNSRSEPSIKRGSQPPDSLIPESLSQAASKVGTPGPASTPAASESNPEPPSDPIAAEIIAAGKALRIHVDETTAKAWAKAATIAQVHKALELARSHGRKPLPQPCPARYVSPILGQIVNEDAKARAAAEAKHTATKAMIAEQQAAAQNTAAMPDKLKPKRRKAAPEPDPAPRKAPEPPPPWIPHARPRANPSRPNTPTRPWASRPGGRIPSRCRRVRWSCRCRCSKARTSVTSPRACWPNSGPAITSIRSRTRRF